MVNYLYFLGQFNLALVPSVPLRNFGKDRFHHSEEAMEDGKTTIFEVRSTGQHDVKIISGIFGLSIGAMAAQGLIVWGNLQLRSWSVMLASSILGGVGSSFLSDSQKASLYKLINYANLAMAVVSLSCGFNLYAASAIFFSAKVFLEGNDDPFIKYLSNKNSALTSA